jgi:hypothetical protein
MTSFRFTLQNGSKHIICPNCQKKTFKPYVDSVTGEVVNPSKYGRCERILNCRYHRYPKIKEDDIESSHYVPERAFIAPKAIDFVDKEIVEATFNQYKTNVFFMYLVKTFGMEVAYQLRDDYNIGTAKGGGTIFWQQDNRDRFRTGKVMYYNSNGRRNKDRMSWFVHKQIADDFNYRQCFFGLHLVDGEKPVALCESEKTAVMMSVFMPEYTWIASGGSEMLSMERLSELKRLDMVFADHGQFEKWEHKTRHFNREMDVTVEQAVQAGILPEGADILDLMLKDAEKKWTMKL